jgi:alkylated DNA repair dioxygenase AlkB
MRTEYDNTTAMATCLELLPGILHYPAYLPDADAALPALRAEVRVAQEHLTFDGKTVPMPRLTGWYGDPGATYRYSGLTNAPRTWTPTMASLRQRLVAAFGAPLNSCLVNVYRDGSRSIGWHADNEPELRGLIVSVSLGATRTFLLREGRNGTPLRVPLAHGDVVTMTVESQRRFQHSVPKEPASGPRMNLTYREIALTS